jgi:hypothetical protein
MANLLKQPYEVSTEVYLKMLIYGQPGIGKSTAGVSAPKAVLIDCDGGIHRISPEHRPPFLPVSNYDEVLTLLAGSEIEPFETIVFDTAGKLLDYMGRYIIKNDPKMGRKDGALTLQGYGVRKYEFVNLLKRVSLMKKHLVFVAHEIEEKDDNQRYIRAEIGGSSGGDLLKELDAVGYMEAIGRKRTISFSPSDKYYAKNSAHLEDIIAVPELKRGETNAFLATIINKCKEEMAKETEIYQQYSALIDSFTEAINNIKTIDDANGLLQTLAETTHIWDSKIKAWDMLQKKAAGINLNFDKKAKKYA